MKTVYSNNELPHLWAHQTQSCGHNSNFSMRFDGPSFWSYHTEIGRILKHNGRTAYLLNTTSYSITTSAHQSRLRQAIPPDATVFEIGDVGQGYSLDDAASDGSKIFDYSVREAATSLAQSKRARKEHAREHALSRHADWLKQARSVARFFGLRRKVDDKAIERLEARLEKERQRQAQEAKKLEARIAAEESEKVARWKAGEPIAFPFRVAKVYLRVKDDVLETSKGATVPIGEARRALKFILKHRNSDGWRRNGTTYLIGSYPLDAVNVQGIIAGCHRIDWEEIERVAKLQGWMN